MSDGDPATGGAAPTTPADIALEEYKALRQQLTGHLQAMTTLVSVALTATAAIAGFAFGSEPGDGYRLQILLALPLVLSGLGLTMLTHTSSVLSIGDYTRTTLWEVLRRACGRDHAIVLISDHGISPPLSTLAAAARGAKARSAERSE